MKKIFLSTLCFLLMLTACSGSPDTESYSSAEQSAIQTEEADTADNTEPDYLSENDTYDSSMQKVTCSNCNGTGLVKYYYGSSALEAALDGHDDYEYGPCSSCDGKGYTYKHIEGDAVNESGAANVICDSCDRYVSSLITKEDAAGTVHSWCSDCWNTYDSILGR